jgi:hypothetical protein
MDLGLGFLLLHFNEYVLCHYNFGLSLCFARQFWSSTALESVRRARNTVIFSTIVPLVGAET